jgi:hypothetical protein
MVYSSLEEKRGVDTFTEQSAAQTGFHLAHGHELMEKVLIEK